MLFPRYDLAQVQGLSRRIHLRRCKNESGATSSARRRIRSTVHSDAAWHGASSLLLDPSRKGSRTRTLAAVEVAGTLP